MDELCALMRFMDTFYVMFRILLIDEMYLIQNYETKFASDLWQVGGYLHQSNWPPWYNWNIVESDVKHYKTKLSLRTTPVIKW